MGLLRFPVGARSHLIEAISGLCRAAPANQDVLDRGWESLHRTTRVIRDEFWEIQKDADLKLRVESVQNKINYTFRNPWYAKQAVHHSSMNPTDAESVSRNRKVVDFTHFKAIEFQGDGVLKRVGRWALCNTGPSPSPTPRYNKFIFNKQRAISAILDTSVCNDHLARIAVRLDLWSILKCSVDKSLEQEVSNYIKAVADGRFDISAPKILADAVEALAGSVYLDSGSIEVFHKVWEDLFLFEDNPVYVLSVTPRKDGVPILPSFRGFDDKRWGLYDISDKDTPKLMTSGITKLEAAFEANKLNR